MGGSSGKNDTLPPLLYNFTAERVNGSDGTATITLSADRMPESLAGELAGATWVYGEHEPKNINDGTRLELARDEIVKPDAVATYSARKTVADLPSKSKVKLGRYGDADLQWLVSRNAENKLILVLATESMTALGSKVLDAAEPSNGTENRQKYGNNRYIYTNLHQWLNAEKGANQWFVKAHDADTPPDYQNQAGFLNGWKKEELDLLELAEWTVTKSSTDGSGTETFRSRLVLPSTTEMGFSTEGGGSKLDIFNGDSDRKTGSTYWTRTPYPTSPCINYQVKSDGTLYSGGYGSYNGTVRPICAIPASTLVSDTTDSDGCYTIQFIPPAQKIFTWHINKDLYARQFTYNSKKQYQTMLSGAIAYSRYIPIAPSQYTETARLNESQKWEAPEHGWFRVVAVASSGNGGAENITPYANSSAGAGGGSGGICVSDLLLQKGEFLDIAINQDVSVTDNKSINMYALRGRTPLSANTSGATSGGAKGSASGGNVANINGTDGESVNSVHWQDFSSGEIARGGVGGKTQYENYTTKGGDGGSMRRKTTESGFELASSATNGTTSYVVILRGNTNQA